MAEFNFDRFFEQCFKLTSPAGRYSCLAVFVIRDLFVNSIINCKFLLGKHKRYGCLRYSSELIAGDECIYDASSKI